MSFLFTTFKPVTFNTKPKAIEQCDFVTRIFLMFPNRMKVVTAAHTKKQPQTFERRSFRREFFGTTTVDS